VKANASGSLGRVALALAATVVVVVLVGWAMIERLPERMAIVAVPAKRSPEALGVTASSLAGSVTPFAVARVSGALPTATAAGLTVTLPPSTFTVVPSATPVPATPTAAATPVPSGPLAGCPIQPIRGFGSLLGSRPAVAEQLGCPQAHERGVTMSIQQFAEGRLFWQADQSDVVALLKTGAWASYPIGSGTPPPPSLRRATTNIQEVVQDHPDLAAALGPARGSERVVSGAVEPFAHGSLIWAPGEAIASLFPDGTWAEYLETSPASTPTVAAESVVTPVVVPTATPAVSLPICFIHPVDGFGLVYGENPSLAARLGCAKANEVSASITSQSFANGLMLRRGDTSEILVLTANKTWAAYPDTWRPGDVLAPAEAPRGQFVPSESLGAVWRQPQVKAALGWATAAQSESPGATQAFAAGQLLLTGDGTVYALWPDHTWQSFVGGRRGGATDGIASRDRALSSASATPNRNRTSALAPLDDNRTAASIFS